MPDYDTEYQDNPELFGGEPSSVIRSLGRLIRAGGKVLDIGVGQGRNALALARAGHRVTGIDPSAVAIEATAEKARETGLELTLWQGSVFDYEVLPASFDAILVLGLFQIMARGDISELVGRVECWLAPGGLAFVTAWHVDDPRHAAIRHRWKKTDRHDYRRSDGEIRAYLGRGEILAFFRGWDVIHHWEGLGPEHRHGESPAERHGLIEFVGRKPTGSSETP